MTEECKFKKTALRNGIIFHSPSFAFLYISFFTLNAPPHEIRLACLNLGVRTRFRNKQKIKKKDDIKRPLTSLGFGASHKNKIFH